MSASTSGTAWVRATPTGRFVVVLPARPGHRPHRLLRALIVVILTLWLLIGG